VAAGAVAATAAVAAAVAGTAAATRARGSTPIAATSGPAPTTAPTGRTSGTAITAATTHTRAIVKAASNEQHTISPKQMTLQASVSSTSLWTDQDIAKFQATMEQTLTEQLQTERSNIQITASPRSAHGAPTARRLESKTYTLDVNIQVDGVPANVKVPNVEAMSKLLADASGRDDAQVHDVRITVKPCASAQATPEKAERTRPTVKEILAEGKRKNLIVIAIGCSAIVIALLVSGVIVWYHYRQTSQASNQPTQDKEQAQDDEASRISRRHSLGDAGLPRQQL